MILSCTFTAQTICYPEQDKKPVGVQVPVNKKIYEQILEMPIAHDYIFITWWLIMRTVDKWWKNATRKCKSWLASSFDPSKFDEEEFKNYVG